MNGTMAGVAGWRCKIIMEDGTELAGPGDQSPSTVFEVYKSRFVDQDAARKLFFGTVNGNYQVATGAYNNAYARQRSRSFGPNFSPGLSAAELATLNSGYPSQYSTAPSLRFTLPVYRMAGGATPTGRISGTYTAFQRFVDEYGNVSDPSPLAAETRLTGAYYVRYSNVEVPTDPRVVKRQIWRNTSGQAQLFYLDIETADLSATAFASSKGDTELQLSKPLALFRSDGEPLAYLYGLPPSNKRCVVAFNNFMFAAAERSFTRGCVSVTNGSAVVTGIGTDWPDGCFEGRFLYVGSDPKGYEVIGCRSGNEITLGSPWQGVTSAYSPYTLKSAPAERSLIYFSAFGLPESWPYTYAWSMDEDGDEITGPVSHRGHLYILKRQHVYRFTFNSTPTQPTTYPPASRGCLHERVAVSLDGALFLMDQEGIYGLGGNDNAEAISNPIGDLFAEDTEGLRINWSAAEHFHAVVMERVIRWFVALSGERYPRHALTFDVDEGKWWIEEYPFAITSSTLSLIGKLKPIVGGKGAKTFLLDTGPLDLVKPDAGDTRGTVTGAGVYHVTTAMDTTAIAAGQPIVIVEGRGKGQVRTIQGVAAGEITVMEPWLIRPSGSGADQSTFQVGGIPFVWQSGVFSFQEIEGNQSRDLWIQFEPTESRAVMDLRITSDNARNPIKVAPGVSRDGVAQKAGDHPGDAHLEIDTSWGTLAADPRRQSKPGIVKIGMDGWQEREVADQNCVELKLSGSSGEERVKLHKIIFTGVVSKNGR